MSAAEYNAPDRCNAQIACVHNVEPDVRATGDRVPSRNFCAIRDLPTPAVLFAALRSLPGFGRARPAFSRSLTRCAGPANHSLAAPSFGCDRRELFIPIIAAAGASGVSRRVATSVHRRAHRVSRSGTSSRCRTRLMRVKSHVTHRFGSVRLRDETHRSADRTLATETSSSVRCRFFRPLERRKLRFFRPWFSDRQGR